tara:strand:+ start:316 stop:1044 length:729 start_codon:yes stop_codon:yes gene_type:complete
MSKVAENTRYLSTILVGLGPSTSDAIHTYVLQNPDDFNEKWRNLETNKYGREIGLSLLRTALSASCNPKLEEQGKPHLKKHKSDEGTLYHTPEVLPRDIFNPVKIMIEHSEKPALKIEDLLEEDEDEFTYEGWRKETKEIRSKILCNYWKKGRCTDHEKGQCDYNHPKKTDLDAYTEGVYTQMMQMVSSEILHALSIKAKREKPSMDVVDTLLALIETYRDGDMTGKDFDKAVDMIRKKVNE